MIRNEMEFRSQVAIVTRILIICDLLCNIYDFLKLREQLFGVFEWI